MNRVLLDVGVPVTPTEARHQFVVISRNINYTRDLCGLCAEFFGSRRCVVVASKLPAAATRYRSDRPRYTACRNRSRAKSPVARWRCSRACPDACRKSTRRDSAEVHKTRPWICQMKIVVVSRKFGLDRVGAESVTACRSRSSVRTTRFSDKKITVTFVWQTAMSGCHLRRIRLRLNRVTE